MRNRYIPLKNYFIAALTIIIILFLSLYFYKWYKVYQEEQTRESYLIKTNTISMQISNIDDIETILSEAPSDYFIYISYTHSIDVLNLEKKLKNIIDDYGINDIVYYIDVTKNKNDIDYLNEINSKLHTNNITNLPAIIYVKDGQIQDENIIQSNKKIISSYQLEQLLKKNDIEKISQE
jgi:hypothetical protein